MIVLIVSIKDRDKGLDGFTLLELLLVISLLSIVLSMTIPRFAKTLSQHTLKQKIQEIFSALTYTQREALHKNNKYGIFFDLTDGNQAIACYQENPNNILINPLTKKPYSIDLNLHEGINNITITGAKEQGDNYYLEFTPLGEPATKTHITIAVSGMNTTYTMHISKIGRITVQ